MEANINFVSDIATDFIGIADFLLNLPEKDLCYYCKKEIIVMDNCSCYCGINWCTDCWNEEVRVKHKICVEKELKREGYSDEKIRDFLKY